jgi:hypothetical protein
MLSDSEISIALTQGMKEIIYQVREPHYLATLLNAWVSENRHCELPESWLKDEESKFILKNLPKKEEQ